MRATCLIVFYHLNVNETHYWKSILFPCFSFLTWFHKSWFTMSSLYAQNSLCYTYLIARKGTVPDSHTIHYCYIIFSIVFTWCPDLYKRMFSIENLFWFIIVTISIDLEIKGSRLLQILFFFYNQTCCWTQITCCVSQVVLVCQNMIRKSDRLKL